MKKFTFIILFFICTLTISSLSDGIFITKNNTSFIKPITPKDDAFHGSINQPSMEWWYFDAVLTNDYGIHIGFKVITIGNWGFVRQLINVYHESEVIKKAYVTRPLDQYHISTAYPDIDYQKQDLITFNNQIYETTGQWIYSITQQLDDITVNLTFTGQTQGFKYETSHECWTVALPQATVNGTLTIDNTTFPVQGSGYHDHNWNFSLTTATKATGWYWGKVRSTQYTLTWANIMKTPFADDTLHENFGVLNTINNGYEFIQSDHIIFTVDEYSYQNGRFIPTIFHLTIDQEPITAEITFETVSIQRTPPDFLTLHYYRYFMNVNGTISIGDQTDQIKNKLHIVEFIRFI